MKTIAFFNNKSGVGKTSLVYHLAYMFAEHHVNVLAVDLDPQANLSSMFIDDDRFETLWEMPEPKTIFSAIQPLLEGTGDVQLPQIEMITRNLGLLVGDLSLSRAEDELSRQWSACVDRDPRAFRVITAFWRVIESAAKSMDAEIVLIDVGPNLGALNRAALIASNAVVIPLAADLSSIQGMRNLGPTLQKWRCEWKERLLKAPDKNLSLPKGEITPLGYVVLQHGMRESRPVKAYNRWVRRIPSVYRVSVLDEDEPRNPIVTADDPYCLAMLKHYRSLMPLAMEAHKPMFQLKPADGAIGAHVSAVRDCYEDFLTLARKISNQVGISIS